MKIRQIATGVVAACIAISTQTFAFEMPTKNPFLADSNNAMGHGTSAQQDSTHIAGPIGPTKVLVESEKEYTHMGPGHFGGNITGEYAGGRRVIWSNGLDRIVKIDHDTNKIIDTVMLDGAKEFTEKKSERIIKNLNRLKGQALVTYGLIQARMFKDLAGVYTLLDNNNDYYMGTADGFIVFGDAIEGNPDSKIKVKRTYTRPSSVTGAFIGMNITFDGWIVLATEHGYVLAVSRDLKEHRITKLKFSENAHNYESSAGKGWVRNGFPIDKDGGIYIASNDHMHKVVWNGNKLSVNEKDGAWTSPYRNNNGENQGTGSTPALMGFGDEDKFVVITDGDDLMNMTLFWRNAIPKNWKKVPGAPSLRVAGFAPVNMGDPERKALQSEQSVVVAGYGALVVNNEPRNIPRWLPKQANALLIGFAGNQEKYQPFGIQKFEWNPETKKLESAWVNKEVSSPNAMPLVSLASDTFYTVGNRDGKWTVEGINLTTGESRFHYVVGDQRYNSLYSGILLDENGDIFYGTIYGKVRIRLNK